jgi:hypothetical protein
MTPVEFVSGIGFVGALGIGFFVALLVGCVMLVVTSTKRWHRKRHAGGWSIMCDHCLKERGYR